MSFVAPHYCCGCDKTGGLLCGNCKYDITSEPNLVCVVCQKPTNVASLCLTCQKAYDNVWVVGERRGSLQRLIGIYKFERAIEAHKPLADLLDSTLPILPDNTVIAPVPTTPARSRERGYDHMLLITRRLAKLRKLTCQPILKRQTDTKQRQSSAKQRNLQASRAFYVDGELDPATPYLIIDDVITTGATVDYAARALKKAGAKTVWVAVVARQTLG